VTCCAQARAFALLVSLATAGCVGGCQSCEDEQPYTPFGVASSLSPSPDAPAAASARVPEPPKFRPKKSILATPGSTRLRLGERTLAAPQDQVFDRALSADFDGDDSEDAVAWLLPSAARSGLAQGGARGELWFFPGERRSDSGAQGRVPDANTAPVRLFELPAFVPASPGCTLEAELSQTGPRTVSLDVLGRCSARLIARSAVRALVVVAPTNRERPIVTMLRLADAAPGESLSVAVSSADRDEDGRDDVEVQFTLQAQATQRPAQAKLVWLDRAAGLAREANEPASSLAARASLEAVRAGGKNTSKMVADGVGNLRRLYAALCAEGGTPRVFDAEGAPLSCGSLRGFVERLAAAEVHAALKLGDPVEALAALTRDGWYHGKVTTQQRAALDKDLKKALNPLPISRVVKLGVRPPRRGGRPRFSPMRFEATGALLVQTPRGVVRVAPDGASEEELGIEAGVERWPLEPVSQSGLRFAGVTQACDRSELLLTFAGPGGAASEPVATRLLAARPGACAGGRAPAALPIAPLAFKPDGLEAIVAGSIVGPRTSPGEAALRPHPPGAPRSPDGRWLVVPNPLGILVTSVQKTELWLAPSAEGGSPLGPPEGLTDCVVANDAKAVACIDGTEARLFLPQR
jgi:hypothetical protein